MNFEQNKIYDFNLIIEGTVIAIKARFTGMGETVAGVECGHFQRVLDDGTDGHLFKWAKKTAIASTPKLWEEERAEF